MERAPGWLTVSLRKRCPRCADGPLFRSALRLRNHCRRCGLDFLGAHGAQYGGAVVLAYGIGGVAALGTLLVLLQIGGLGGNALWITLAVAILAVALSFRTCKAFWTWVLYRAGELDRS